jgi:hypothetical protein
MEVMAAPDCSSNRLSNLDGICNVNIFGFYRSLDLGNYVLYFNNLGVFVDFSFSLRNDPNENDRKIDMYDIFLQFCLKHDIWL